MSPSTAQSKNRLHLKKKEADNEEDEDDERKANTHGAQEASAAFVDTMQYKHQREGRERGLLSMHRCVLHGEEQLLSNTAT